MYDAFGPDRMFWGTDITRRPCSWRQCVTLFIEELHWLSQLRNICLTSAREARQLLRGSGEILRLIAP